MCPEAKLAVRIVLATTLRREAPCCRNCTVTSTTRTAGSHIGPQQVKSNTTGATLLKISLICGTKLNLRGLLMQH